MSASVEIVIALVGLVAFLALLVLVARVLRVGVGWRRWRVGVFAERDDNGKTNGP